MVDEPAPSDEVLRRLFDEAQRVVDRQIAGARAMDERAAQVFRFNALMIGLLVTAVSLFFGRPAALVAVPSWVRVLFAAGFAAVFVSTVMAVRAYRVTGSDVGLRAEQIVAALGFRAVERGFLVEAVRSYGSGIAANAQVLDEAARWLARAMMGLLVGLLCLTAAAIALISIGGH